MTDEEVLLGDRIDVRAARVIDDLTTESRSLARVATAMRPLARAKAYADFAKVSVLLARLEQKVEGLGVASGRGRALIESVRGEVDAERRRLREGLAASLKQACDAAGLALRVVSREEPVEVRIAPLAVVIDRDRGRAEVRFAKQPLESCAANAGEILAARERALDALRAGFDPALFFRACHKAWLAARGAGEAGASERVEIQDFLAYLALQFQRPAFRVEPSRKNFRDYSRARFAFDLLQLQRAGMLAVDGWRLNLGVATGATATKQNRALWLEDEEGQGEFKLTVFFSRTQEPP